MDHQAREALLYGENPGASTSSDGQHYNENEILEDSSQPDEHSGSSQKFPQYVAALTATLSALSAGAVLGWTSPILSEMENGHFHNITVDKSQMGWIGSFVTLGGMTMCIPTGFLCDLIGRKKTLLFLILPFAVGWSLILLAKSVIMIYLGRLITGMAAGASCVAAPLYTSEIAESKIRGTLGSYFQLMVTVGIFLAYTFGKFLTPVNYTLFCAALPIFFVGVFSFQPETPVYLLRRGLYDEGLKALIRLRGPNHDSEAELRQIEGMLKESLGNTVSISDTFKRKAVWKASIIAFALMFFQQFSGINAVILYTSDIFKASGVSLDANTAAILVGAFQTLATFASSLVIDKKGRKILLLISSLVMFVSSFFLAVFFTLKHRISIDPVVLLHLGFLPIVSLCVFVIFFSIGLGPIPWMISSEIFAPEVKSVASSAAGTFNWFLAFIVTKFYLQVSQSIGEDSTFYGFAITSLLGGLFIYLLVPETKGKSIEQVQDELEG